MFESTKLKIYMFFRLNTKNLAANAEFVEIRMKAINHIKFQENMPQE